LDRLPTQVEVEAKPAAHERFRYNQLSSSRRAINNSRSSEGFEEV